MYKDVAIKKVVQPTLVQEFRQSEDGKHEARPSEESVSSAAAVAAVSAVIATQPFLKVGHSRTTMLELIPAFCPNHILIQTGGSPFKH